MYHTLTRSIAGTGWMGDILAALLLVPISNSIEVRRPLFPSGPNQRVRADAAAAQLFWACFTIVVLVLALAVYVGYTVAEGRPRCVVQLCVDRWL